MTWTTPFTAVTGAVITSAGWNTSARDNLLHLRALLPDPSGSGQVLISTGTTGAAFTTGGAVPSGLVAMFRTAAAIATGWTRESNLDGRIPVGAGTTFTVTYVEDTAYGSGWSHQHAGPSHQHSVSGTTDQNSGTTSNLRTISPQEADAASNNHTHTYSATSGSGGNGDTSANATNIPLRAYVFAKKD